MKKLSLADITPLPAYELERVEFRRRIIELKTHRRVTAGDLITLVFENRDTMRFQVQEMARAERIDDERKIQDELEIYNHLIPGPGELSATLFIEITEPDRIKAVLDRLKGIKEPGRVRLELGGERSEAIFEAGTSDEEKISAVHYVRFRLSPELQRRLADPALSARIVVDHLHYQAAAELSLETRRALLADLQQP